MFKRLRGSDEPVKKARSLMDAKILDKVADILGDFGLEPEQGEHAASCVIPLLPKTKLDASALSRIAMLVYNFILVNKKLVIYFAGTDDIKALERASLQRRTTKHQSHLVINQPSKMASAGAVTRQLAVMLDTIGCKEYPLPNGGVSLVATVKRALASEVLDLLKDLSAYNASLACVFQETGDVEVLINI